MTLRSDWDLLLLAARGGDVRALGRLVEVAGDDLRSAASGVVGPTLRVRLPADDVYSDALIAVLRDIRSLRASNYAGFRYWFASIARNHVRRTLRSEHRRRDGSCGELEPEDEEEEVFVVTEENEDFVRYALLNLPHSQQIAFVLREGLGLAWRTIGFVLERREGPAARLLHYRAVVGVRQIAGTRPELRPLAIRA
jgi:RNA polymerase sigma factor (sigma-70 family)